MASLSFSFAMSWTSIVNPTNVIPIPNVIHKKDDNWLSSGRGLFIFLLLFLMPKACLLFFDRQNNLYSCQFPNFWIVLNFSVHLYTDKWSRVWVKRLVKKKLLLLLLCQLYFQIYFPFFLLLVVSCLNRRFTLIYRISQNLIIWLNICNQKNRWNQDQCNHFDQWKSAVQTFLIGRTIAFENVISIIGMLFKQIQNDAYQSCYVVKEQIIVNCFGRPL